MSYPYVDELVAVVTPVGENRADFLGRIFFVLSRVVEVCDDVEHHFH